MSDKNKKSIQLKLYITEETEKTKQMIEKLEKILQDELSGKYNLEVINIVEHPKLAEEEKILATPTLEKKLPPPVRRIVGDLSEKEGVLVGLDLVSK